MKVAELLIRQGAVTEVIRGRSDSQFDEASRQLASFQEKVEEINYEFLEAQGKQRALH